jgi:5-methylcytosine-specific restriction endonuclease McrA
MASYQMRKQRRKKTIDLHKASLRTLVGQMTRASRKVDDLRIEADRIGAQLAALGGEDEIALSIKQCNQRIEELQTHRIKNRSFSGWLLGTTEVTTAALEEIAKENSTISKLKSNQLERRRLEHKRTEINRYITNLGNWMAKLEVPLSKRKKQQEKVDNLKAIAATNQKQSRSLASNIKQRMVKNELCPYCGNALDGRNHLDHIYPISKGGRSTERNMVWVCGSCNIRKGDLTLAAFIKNNNLNRIQVEKNLESLGKEY